MYVVAGEFLVKLQTLKATGDVAGAEALFARYSRLEEPWARWRDIVMLHKQPRNIFVQPNTVLKGIVQSNFVAMGILTITSYADLMTVPGYEQWNSLIVSSKIFEFRLV